jgi:hypothetical protein
MTSVWQSFTVKNLFIVDCRAALPDHPRAPSTAPVPVAVAVSAAPNRRRLKGRDVLGMLGDVWNKADITDVLYISIYFLELKFKSCMVVWWCRTFSAGKKRKAFESFFSCACCCKMWPGTAAWDKRNYWAAVHVNKSSSSPPGCLNSKESTS